MKIIEKVEVLKLVVDKLQEIQKESEKLAITEPDEFHFALALAIKAVEEMHE